MKSAVRIAVICLLMLLGCTKQPPQQNLKLSLTYEEHNLLKEFCLSILVQESGIYTLFGTKPLIIGTLYNLPHTEMSEESMKTHVNQLISLGPEVLHDSLNGLIIQGDTHGQVWRKIASQLPMKNYRIFFVPEELVYYPGFVSQGDELLAIVNKQQLVYLLQQHYPLFVKAAGIEFSPEDVVEDIDNVDGFFWQRLFCTEDHRIKGLFYGFGLTNASCFDLVHNKEENACLRDLLFHPSSKPKCLHPLSIQDLELPGFCCADHMMRLYDQERAEILREFEGEDFLQCVLRRLISPAKDPSITLPY